jgi:hypothetical protein
MTWQHRDRNTWTRVHRNMACTLAIVPYVPEKIISL